MLVASLASYGFGVFTARTSSDSGFQECLFATFFVPPDQRGKITEQKLEDVCHIDGAHVQQVRADLVK